MAIAVGQKVRANGSMTGREYVGILDRYNPRTQTGRLRDLDKEMSEENGGGAVTPSVERVRPLFVPGDKVKFQFKNGEDWFAAEILNQDPDGRYRGKLINQGTGSLYTQTDVQNGFLMWLGNGENLTPYNPEEENKMNPEITPALLGRKPEPVPGPKHTAPFRSESRNVLDSNGEIAFFVDSDDKRYEDDCDMAATVALALNKFFQEA